MKELKVLREKVEAGSGENWMHVKVPDLKPFDGSRDSNDLENFIWDLE